MSDLNVIPEEMPEWLTIEFFREYLEIREDFHLKSVQHACAKGDNFASKIYRVELDFGGGEIESLILKSRPIGSGFCEEFVKKFNVFPKEIEMYAKIDQFEKLFKSAGHNITFAPKFVNKLSTSFGLD